MRLIFSIIFLLSIVSADDSLSVWQIYCNAGDTISASPNINQWVVISVAKDRFTAFADTVYATYWSKISNDNYYVNSRKYGSIWVEFCYKLPDSLTRRK